jgi:hypothetical protein
VLETKFRTHIIIIILLLFQQTGTHAAEVFSSLF